MRVTAFPERAVIDRILTIPIRRRGPPTDWALVDPAAPGMIERGSDLREG